MFGSRFSKQDGGDVGKERFATLIGEHTTIKGDMVLSAGIRIDGQLDGNLSAASEAPVSAVIGQTGKVTGNIAASRVVVAGTVRGNILATEEVELLPTAVVEGDVQCKSLRVAHGARMVCRVLSGEPPAGAHRPVLVSDRSEPAKAALGAA